MDSTFLLKVLLLAAACWDKVEGISKVRSYITGVKSFEPKNLKYVPGGNRAVIEPIQSPVASFNSLAVVANAASSKYNKGSNAFGMVTSITDIPKEALGMAQDKIATIKMTTFNNNVKTAIKWGKRFQKIAPFLGPAFGIVSSIFGFLPGFEAPGPDKILEKVNEAFAKLTGEINSRLNNMVKYVDQQILDLKLKLNGNFLDELLKRWAGCIKWRTAEKVNTCQLQSDARFLGKQSFFMPFNKIAETNNPLTAKQVRELEISMIVFMQYATYRLMGLQTIINTYGADKTLEEGPGYFNDYRRYYKSATVMYANYADWAVKQILTAHNCKGAQPYPFQDGEKKPTEYNIKESENNFCKAVGFKMYMAGFRGIKWRKSEAFEEVHCDPLNEDTDCSAYGVAYLDDHCGWCYCTERTPDNTNCVNGKGMRYRCARGTRRRDFPGATDRVHASVILARNAVVHYCGIGMKPICKNIYTYWEKEVLRTSQLWPKLGEAMPAPPPEK